MIQKLLPFPNIKFSISHNGKEILKWNGSDNFLDLVSYLFSKTLADKLLFVDKNIILKDSELNIKAYFTKPEHIENTRNNMYFFVNNRYFFSASFSQAVLKAYEGILEKGKYPVCFLFLNLDPSLIDCNIHPTKKDIKIQNESSIFSAIYHLVKDEFSTGQESFNEFSTNNKKIDVYHNDLGNILLKKKDTPKDVKNIQTEIFNNQETIKNKDNQVENIIPDKSYIRIIGQVFNSFVIMEYKDDMLLIDQHAAHERIKYDNLVENIKNGETASQLLSTPILVDLLDDELDIYETNIEAFTRLGLIMSKFGDNSFQVNSIPEIINSENVDSFIHQLISNLKSYSDVTINDICVETIATRACKSAIKAGDSLTSEELINLINEIINGNHPLTCPHGRPIIAKLHKDNISKMFRRT